MGALSFFTARRQRRERADAALARLEAGAVAAEAQAARLAEAVAVSHRALALLHDRLVGLAEQSARIDGLVDHARTELEAAAREVAAHAVERVAARIEAAAARLDASVRRRSARSGQPLLTGAI